VILNKPKEKQKLRFFRNFKEAIENGCFIDKSLLIKNIIDCGNKLLLITRPRQFGKTFNLSMLKYFFSGEDESHFKELKISSHDRSTYFRNGRPFNVLEISFSPHMVTFVLQNATSVESTSNFEQTLEVIDITNDMFVVSICQKISNYLHQIHERNKRDIIILIDDYERLLCDSIMKKSYSNALSILKGVIDTISRVSYVKYVILVGTLLKRDLYSGISIFDPNDFNKKMSNSFGFTSEEANSIITRYDTSSDGIEHFQYEFSGEKLYSPSLLIQNLGQHNISDPSDDFTPFLLEEYSNNDVLNEKLVLLKEKDEVDIEFSIDSLQDTKDFLQKFQFHDSYRGKNPILLWSYLVQMGYLTYYINDKTFKFRVIDRYLYKILEENPSTHNATPSNVTNLSQGVFYTPVNNNDHARDSKKRKLN